MQGNLSWGGHRYEDNSASGFDRTPLSSLSGCWEFVSFRPACPPLTSSEVRGIFLAVAMGRGPTKPKAVLSGRHHSQMSSIVSPWSFIKALISLIAC